MNILTNKSFVIPFVQKEEWTKYVSKAHKYDFYHTWDYQEVAKVGDPVLFVYEDGENFITLPLLKREIPNTEYVDFHSVYGYTGPISNLPFVLHSDAFIEDFQNALLQFLKDEKAISVFVKFHPFFDQERVLEGLGGIYENGNVVAIDLIQSLEDQRKRYNTNTRKNIQKSRELGFTLRLMEGQEDIKAFTKLYNDSMDRIGASDFYKFNEDYFTALLNSNQCNAKLLFVMFDNKIVCGSVVTFTHGIIQAHLLATDYDYIKYSPAKFMADEICLLGREHGMEYFHLGGGQGYKDNSLFEWKLSFSDLVLSFNSWRFVVDQDIYKQLVEKSGHDINDTIDFFPLYRLSN